MAEKAGPVVPVLVVRSVFDRSDATDGLARSIRHEQFGLRMLIERVVLRVHLATMFAAKRRNEERTPRVQLVHQLQEITALTVIPNGLDFEITQVGISMNLRRSLLGLSSRRELPWFNGLRV
jgi:hypothetical protein